jgi:hypothetical protein
MVAKGKKSKSDLKAPEAPNVNPQPIDTYLPPIVEPVVVQGPCSTTQPNNADKLYIFQTETDIASELELKKFWTLVINSGVSIKDRLKASELLGKSLAMFTEKLDANVNVGKELEEIVKALSRERNA